MNKINKILVANRGEIAIRVLRAASELRITTVAIYTYEDRYSLHRYKADESYQIGPEDEALKPYLDIEEIILVAKSNGVDAIHPGYGFLSENQHFVKRCGEENITFIGPSVESMKALGDKISAKKIADKLQIPTIPSIEVLNQSESELIESAKQIGLPVIIKAAAGGGGRGMRVIRKESDLLSNIKEASGEALKSFGDGTVFIEKFIEKPKHIEVQILGDHHGQLVHLYERDCSVQRRFQKVVEIAPAPTLSEGTKNKLYEHALKICSHVNYYSAGTVEFLVDRFENIFFIEVNPRIQVEHTVTEEITGVDIVRAQILIAQGVALADKGIYIASQDDVKVHGFAIQCRITTEDPVNNFKPDYGKIIAYRSASGFGIRLDAGSSYPGSVISPFFDSMLVKVTGWGRTLTGASQRIHRALREFRIRGVKTNINFLLHLLSEEEFIRGEATVDFINEHPELLIPDPRQDRGTKLLRYLANVEINGNSDVPFQDENRTFEQPIVPDFDKYHEPPKGTRNLLKEKGRDALLDWLKKEKRIQYTDTTFRDAHQSLLATRMRTYDMLKVADVYAHSLADKLFSMEMWGGATFDVCMRFLKEDPWTRLRLLREKIPNTLFQMLLRGSNAVGYAAYPDNLVQKFIVKASENGMDIFRIFDSLNWMESMRMSIKTVIQETDSIAEACICYTGDISDPTRQKYDLQYYLDLARQLEDEGAHILAIKDMSGLLKPAAANMLVTALKKHLSIPIHLHTHDTSSIQAATYMQAIDVGVDVVDVAISSMSGLTSQPNFNALVEITKGHERANDIPMDVLNPISNYWEKVRQYYYPFESELKAGTAEVYQHEIPGGQYSNLKPQARALGLAHKFETIKHNYKEVNKLFGDIIKVTPSSKVVGDMAMFMTSNDLTAEDVLERGESLSFPDSVKALFRGDLGQAYGGFPKRLQKLVLKDEEPYTDRPNAHMEPVDFKKEFSRFKKQFGKEGLIEDFISYKLYPKVFTEFHEHHQKYGWVRNLPSPAFFYGLKPNEEILVEITKGKNLLIQFLNVTEPNEKGYRTVVYKLNGQTRSVEILDESVQAKVERNQKVENPETQVGAPLQGSLAKILVKKGDKVNQNTPLFIIEAMKMESTITSPKKGVVQKIYLKEKNMVEQDDLVLELKVEN
jgi:pyruvate carboxylase